MNPSKRSKRPTFCMGRRNFLTAALLGPAVAAFFARRPRPLPAAPPKPAIPDGARYRLTDHVRRYYETL